MRVLDLIDVTGNDHVPVGGVVFIDLEFAASDNEPTETRHCDYLGRIAALGFADARQYNAFAVGHVERMRRELAARVFLIYRFFHIQCICVGLEKITRIY